MCVSVCQQGVWFRELHLSHSAEEHERERPTESSQLPHEEDPVAARTTSEGVCLLHFSENY